MFWEVFSDNTNVQEIRRVLSNRTTLKDERNEYKYTIYNVLVRNKNSPLKDSNEPPRHRAVGYQVVIPESPKGLSVIRHAHHPALGHELGPNGATSKGNLDSRFRGNDRNSTQQGIKS